MLTGRFTSAAKRMTDADVTQFESQPENGCPG